MRGWLVRSLLILGVMLSMYFWASTAPLFDVRWSVAGATDAVADLIRAAGIQSERHGASFVQAGIRIRVTPSCTGLDVAAIGVAALLAAPATLQARVIGVLVLLPVVFVTNCVRIALLCGICAHAKPLFWTAYYALQPICVGFVAVGYALLWWRLARRAADVVNGPT